MSRWWRQNEGWPAASAQQGLTVPKGVMHRTRAPVRSVILMIEGKGVVPTGD